MLGSRFRLEAQVDAVGAGKQGMDAADEDRRVALHRLVSRREAHAHGNDGQQRERTKLWLERLTCEMPSVSPMKVSP